MTVFCSETSPRASIRSSVAMFQSSTRPSNKLQNSRQCCASTNARHALIVWDLISVWIAGEVGGLNPLPNCFFNPPKHTVKLCTVYIWFTSQFCFVSDRRKVQSPADFSQFKHWIWYNCKLACSNYFFVNVNDIKQTIQSLNNNKLKTNMNMILRNKIVTHKWKQALNVTNNILQNKKML